MGNLTSKAARRQRVMVEEPHLKSRAALLLLCLKLEDEEISEWLIFRKEFLGQYKTLTCSHCGKTNLQIDTDDEDLLATVDHIVCLSQGGKKFDKKNCIVSCYSCNNNRGDLSVEEYRIRRETAVRKHKRRCPEEVIKGY